MMFQEFFKKRKTNKDLAVFYAEVKKNLESFYVMDQREYFKLFMMEGWGAVKENAGLKFPSAVTDYVKALEAFNSAKDEHDRFEEFYTATMDNRTKANATVLHDKKEILKQKFQGLESVIKAAIKPLENELRLRGIIKNVSRK